MDKRAEQIALAAAAEANHELGITQTYNKENRDRLWDSAKGKQEYKKQVFDGKKTYVDPISGKTLHHSQKAAQNKYGMKNAEGENVSRAWADHAAETDHIVPLKQVHTRAELCLNADLTVRTAKNMGSEFKDGAVQTVQDSVIPLMAEGVRQLCGVMKGEKTLGEAARDMGRFTAEVTVVGGTKRLAADQAASMIRRNAPQLSGQAFSDSVNQLVRLALIVKDSAVRYINGEIDGQGFLDEIGDQGACLAASMIGGELGREIGAFLGLMGGGP